MATPKLDALKEIFQTGKRAGVSPTLEAAIAQEIANTLDAEEDELRKRLDELAKERAALESDGQVTLGTPEEDEQVGTLRGLEAWSVQRLLLRFIGEHPGANSAECIAFVKSAKGEDFDPKNVYAGLYKATLRGHLRKVSKGGVLTYFIVEKEEDSDS